MHNRIRKENYLVVLVAFTVTAIKLDATLYVQSTSASTSRMHWYKRVPSMA